MLLATCCALFSASALPQATSLAIEALEVKPPPRMEREVDLKAALDPRRLAGPALEALSGFTSMDLGLLGPNRAPEVQASHGLGTPSGEPFALSGPKRTWTRSVEELFFDAPGDGSLWVRGASYKAQVAAEGFTFIPFLGSQAPRNWPVRFELRAARLGGQSLALALPSLVREGNGVTLDRGALLERYRFELGEVEQLFVLEELRERGELELALAIESDLAPRAEGSGLAFDGPDGGVTYGGVTVLDAAGRSLSLPSRLEGDRIVLRVPAEFVAAATLPLTIDPIIAEFGLGILDIEASNPQVAYAPAGDLFQVVWQENFSLGDRDIYAARYTSGGSFVSFAYLDITPASWSNPTLAYNRLADNFLTAAEVLGAIVGRTWGVLAGGLGAQIVLAVDENYVLDEPSLGGDESSLGPTYYLLAYSRHYAPGDQDIHATLLDGQGSPVGGTILIDNSSATDDRMPRVSKTLGAPPYSSQRWNVTWVRQAPNGHRQGRLAQLAWDGVIEVPSQEMLLANETGESFLVHCPSPPLDDPTGAARDWVALYVSKEGTHHNFRSILINEGLGITHLTVGPQEADPTPSDLSIDWRGCAGVAEIMVTPESSPDSAHPLLLTLRVGWMHLVGPNEWLDHDQVTYDPVFSDIAMSSIEGGPALAVRSGASNGEIGGSWYEPASGCVGTTSCNSLPNSSGFEAFLHANGSPNIAYQNSLILLVKNLPQFKSGLMLMSASLGHLPLGQGILCLSPPVYRFPIGDFSGEFGRIDSFPIEEGPTAVTITPGSTWHFQYWTRDVGTTNFSNSVTITFE